MSATAAARRHIARLAAAATPLLSRRLSDMEAPPIIEVEPASEERAADAQPKRHFLPDAFDKLKIRTKDRRIITLRPNAVQAMYLDVICPGWRTAAIELRGLRELILKARQQGFSTLILALFFIDTISTPNTQTVVIAHDSDSTIRLFRMVQRFYEHLPADLKPVTKLANRREYLWPVLDSYFFVGTAGAGEFGRGGTINNVHGSEVAFWPNGEEVVAGLLETVPDDGNVFLESTANGFGNYYEKEWHSAEINDSVFAPRFFAWFQNPEYRREPPPDFKRTEEEEKLAHQFDLSDWQLAWRRWKKKALREKFEQEYPATAEEAFLTSGNPYFDRDRIKELIAFVRTPEARPLSDVQIPSAYPNLRAAYQSGRFLVWALPIVASAPGAVPIVKPGGYVIGADTAEGITDGGDHDYCSADVLDADTGIQVAQLHGRWDTHHYGILLAELGRWYNIALLGIERNNHGHAVINAALYTAGYPEARSGSPHGLYYHQEYNEDRKPTIQKPGWPTTPKTKYFALDGLATSILEGEIHPRSARTVQELLNYVKLPGGKAGGEGGSHDDAVISLAIADAMIRLRPRGWAHDPDFLRKLAGR